MRRNRTKRRRTRRRRRMRGGAWYNPMSWGQTTNSAGEAEGGWFSGLFGKKKKAPGAGISEPDSPQEPVDGAVQPNPNEPTDPNPSFDAGSEANDGTQTPVSQDGAGRRRRKRRKSRKSKKKKSKRGGGCGCSATNLVGGRRRRTHKRRKTRRRRR